MISIRNVRKSFDLNQVLKGVSFDLDEGELVGLVGPSGGGKSVLLKIIGDVLCTDSGEISAPEGTSTGILFQEGALFDSMSVLDNVAFPLASGSEYVPRSECNERAYQALCSVGLGKDYAKFPGQISGGMRRRVALARAIVARPSVVLLDDPTGGLDPVAASVILELVKEIHAEYKPIMVLVSHDIRRLLPNVPRIISLFDGQIVSDCQTSELPGAAPDKVVSFLATRYDFSSSSAAQ